MATENLTPEEEFEQGMAEAMYCTACQALLWQDCICEEDDEENYFPYVDKEPEEDEGY